MQSSNIPAKFALPFGASAGGSYIRTIPSPSQIGVTPGAASLTDGFPPVCFLPIASGGVPPSGLDFNGLLNQMTAWERWQAAGAAVPYDSTFQTAIGGYPAGAVVASTVSAGLNWLSTADNNVTNPDTGGAGWIVAWRQRLSADVTLYVTTGGNDTTGTGAIGAPWATIQKAVNVLAWTVDLNGHNATISVAAGTYSSQAIRVPPIVGLTFTNVLTLQGAGVGSSILTSTLADNWIIATSAQNLTVTGFTLTSTNGGCLASSGGVLTVANCTMSATGTGGAYSVRGYGLSGQAGCQIWLGTGVTFGACAAVQINLGAGATFASFGNAYTVSGGGSYHQYIAAGAAAVIASSTVTFSATANFTGGFIGANSAGSCFCPSMTFVNSTNATGTKYVATFGGWINTNGAGTSYLPGANAGSSTTGYYS